MKSNNVHNPMVSIIILNWNGQKHIHKCLEHVLNQTYEPLEIIIVDNGSTDGSIKKLKEMYPNLVYIENNKNLGYAVGMNQGISKSKGEFIIPLNQDVCLHKDFIEKCVSRIMQDEKIGAIGGRAYCWIGDELTNLLRKGEGELFFFRKRFQGFAGTKSDKEAFVFAPSGSYPFFRRKMLEDIRETSGYYYDESFETGWEDNDLFFRIQLRGWKCLFYPYATVWHVGSGSVEGKSTLLDKSFDYQRRIFRNRYFTMIKNLPIDTFFWLFPYILVTELLLIPYLLIRSPKSLFALFISWWQVLKSFRSLKEKRHMIKKNTIVPKGHLKKYFIAF